MKREQKIANRIERAKERREKNKQRSRDWYNKPRWRRCDQCGGEEQWCTLCEVWTRTCCVAYGTCLCS